MLEDIGAVGDSLKLYQSKGFTKLSEVKGLVEMELPLGTLLRGCHG
nr:hypothetical protein [Vibrio splendidus]